jgi:glycosyltransferase involved in cell wall biosynthesis
MIAISVVMSVYNGASQLPQTLDSIAAQSESNFELIVIDDGSTDGSGSILDDYASRDSRIRVISQANAGLTRSLIRGCAAARAPIIARHDCGDSSAPDRFREQLAAFDDPAVVLASCWVSHRGPGDEPLFDVRAGGAQVRESILHDTIDNFTGLPHHGSTMFRRDAYERAGGYREEFWFAQDLDLWIRMAPHGTFIILPEVLYQSRFSVASISAQRRNEQVALATIAMRLRDPSMNAGARDALIDQARAIRPSGAEKGDDAGAYYFLARCLQKNGDPRHKRYAREALRRSPLNPRVWMLFLR